MDQPERSIALYVDIENFAGTCLGLGLPIDLAPEIDKLTEFGRVTIRRSFGDILKIPLAPEQKKQLRTMLQRSLVQHEDVPYLNNFKTQPTCVLPSRRSPRSIQKTRKIAATL